MEQWEYLTTYLVLEAIQYGQERREEYVATFSDNTRIEGLEMVLRRFLDDGGWELVSMIPTGFRHTSQIDIVADELTAIFRRKVPI
jgi:hypothetical protein